MSLEMAVSVNDSGQIMSFSVWKDLMGWVSKRSGLEKWPRMCSERMISMSTEDDREDMMTRVKKIIMRII